MTSLTIALDTETLNVLEQIAQAQSCTVEDVVQEVLHSFVQSTLQLDLAALGEGMLTALQMMKDADYVHTPVAVSDELLAKMQMHLLPDDVTRTMLGDELLRRLIGVPADAALTAGDSERLTAVTSVCQVLKGTLNEAGVRRWWTKRRYQLGGVAPAGLIGGGSWTPGSLAFREIVALAEADAGFAAT